MRTDAGIERAIQILTCAALAGLLGAVGLRLTLAEVKDALSCSCFVAILLANFILIPVPAVAAAKGFGVRREIAVAMVLLAASPFEDFLRACSRVTDLGAGAGISHGTTTKVQWLLTPGSPESRSMRAPPFLTATLVTPTLALSRRKIFRAGKTSKYSRSNRSYRIRLLSVGAALLATQAAFADDLTTESRAALRQLVAQNKSAATASSKALAVLIFPNVVKAGFIVGAHGGEGRLFINGKAAGRYRTSAASYGLQAGVQKYGYALFFMNQKALDWVNTTKGWEIGSGPSVVLVDKGMARSFTTSTMHSGIYAFTFDQKGLMAGTGIQGSRIKRIR